jgi:hypothetical protein
MHCSGNNNEICGGYWANSVSRSGAEPSGRSSELKKQSPISSRAGLRGEWEIVEGGTTYRATLDRNGNGPYTFNNGQFTTTDIKAGQWQGTWRQTANDREGGFELMLSEDGTEAKGTWWYSRVGGRKDIPPRQEGGTFVWKRISSFE